MEVVKPKSTRITVSLEAYGPNKEEKLVFTPVNGTEVRYYISGAGKNTTLGIYDYNKGKDTFWHGDKEYLNQAMFVVPYSKVKYIYINNTKDGRSIDKQVHKEGPRKKTWDTSKNKAVK